MQPRRYKIFLPQICLLCQHTHSHTWKCFFFFFRPTHPEYLKQHFRWKHEHTPQHLQDGWRSNRGADLQHALTRLFADHHAHVCMTGENPYLCFNAIDKAIKCVSLCEGRANGAMGLWFPIRQRQSMALCTLDPNYLTGWKIAPVETFFFFFF